MSKVYWDTMLFIYLLEDTPEHGKRVVSLYESMRELGDVLCTSVFTLAELLAGPKKLGDTDLERRVVALFEGGEINVLPFDSAAAKQFATIRATVKVSPADAIHLACASSSGVDLFLTSDTAIREFPFRGILFIDGLQTSVLGGYVE